jgi:Myb/SANT-like DNA-binding domain
MEAPKKRQRGTNMSTAEKALLADLCVKHRNIIENKRTDGVSARQKDEAWLLLAAEFAASSTSGLQRTAAQLRNVSYVETRYLLF